VNYALNIGDIVRRPKKLGILTVMHEGVVVGLNQIFHNSPGKGEHITTLQEFAEGQKVEVTRTGADSLGLIARVKRMLTSPKAYSLFSRNCQHTSSEAVTGKPKSSSVEKFALVILIVFAIVFIVSQLAKKR